MKIKLRLAGLLVLSSMLMVGCGETSTSAENQTKVESENSGSILETQQDKLEGLMPDSVKDGTVSEEMYLEVFKYINEFTAYHKEITDLQKNVNRDFSLLDNATFKEKYLTALDDYEVFIKDFHPSPNTSADFELNDNFSDILYNTSSYINEIRNFVKTKDTYHTDNASTYIKSVKTSNEALIITINKYELFSE